MSETDVLKKKCYSIEEIMEILGLCRSSVMKLIRANEFKWMKIGPVYRIPKEGFDLWLQQKLGIG